MGGAISYFDEIIQVTGVLEYLSELSYHRYGQVSDANLQAIADRAVQYGINTSMLEHIGSGYQDLHDDLKTGRNSAWQQYVLAYPGDSDNGGSYYRIDNSDPDNPEIIMGERTKFIRQYFKYIRNGAVRIGVATNNEVFDPMAFINNNNKYVVILKGSTGGSFTIQNLPAGDYGITYTTSSEYDVELPDVTINTDQDIITSIPAAGVLTVFAKPLATLN